MAPVGVALGVGLVNGVGHVLPDGLISVRNALVLSLPPMLFYYFGY